MAGVTNKKWRNFFWSRWFLAIGFLVVIFVITAFARAFYEDYQVRQEIARLQEDVKRLEVKKLSTLDALAYVKSEDFIEEKARLELNLAKPGEQIGLIPNVAGIKVGQKNDNMLEFKNLANPIKWLNYFLHKN